MSTPRKRPARAKAGWIAEHIADPYVQRAQRDGYRARSAYKLLEIDRRDKLLRPGLVVLDLGAAPGSWSQVARQKVGTTGKILALDLLPIEPLAGVDMLRGDFTDPAVLAQLREFLGGKPVDLVLCDMAPNLSGVASTDQARGFDLCERAFEFCRAHLRPGGNFLVKVFHGGDYEAFVRTMRTHFTRVQVRKPEASRSRSSEVYLLGTGARQAA